MSLESRLPYLLALVLTTACLSESKDDDDDDDDVEDTAVEWEDDGGSDDGGDDGDDGGDGGDDGGDDGSDGGGDGGGGSGDDDADDDGDGFTNGEEAAAGTNPDNPYSRPYTGGYNTGDCQPTATGPSGATYANGDVPENFTFVDQHGEEVDLYSFCGVSLMVIIGAEWCGPCNDLASQVQPFQDAVNEEGLNHQVIELLIQDSAGRAADADDAARWASSHGLTTIPSLAADTLGGEWDKDGYIPTIILIDDTMTIRSFDEGDTDPSPYW